MAYIVGLDDGEDSSVYDQAQVGIVTAGYYYYRP